MSARVQLLMYGIAPGADFQGHLVGALERLESGGALRVLEALFVRSDPDDGGLTATGLRGRGAGGIVAPLLSFRLDPAEQRRATKRALSDTSSGVPAETIQALAAALEPGAAFAAVLVEHLWHGVLSDAVARTGGAPLGDEFVDAGSLADVAPRLLAAAGG